MANTRSSKKDLRRSAKKRAVNLSVRSGLKTHVKKARSGEGVVEAVSALDKAVQRGIIHKNQAARRKSRMMKAANAAGTAGATGEAKPKKAPAKKK